jgi:hypothetical protein
MVKFVLKKKPPPTAATVGGRGVNIANGRNSLFHLGLRMFWFPALDFTSSAQPTRYICLLLRNFFNLIYRKYKIVKKIDEINETT